MADSTFTHSFFETLKPLLRRVNAERTLSPGKMGVLRHLAEEGRATTSELELWFTSVRKQSRLLHANLNACSSLCVYQTPRTAVRPGSSSQPSGGSSWNKS
jgi:hypothetical protein